jgi:hypothetical protein
MPMSVPVGGRLPHGPADVRPGLEAPAGSDEQLPRTFETSAFEPVGLPEPITLDDPDLVATAQLFGLLV